MVGGQPVIMLVSQECIEQIERAQWSMHFGIERRRVSVPLAQSVSLPHDF